MKTLTALLVTAVAAALVLLYRQDVTIKQLDAQIRNLSKPATRSTAAHLDLQEKCSAQARRFFTDSWKESDMADYINHYNPTLNRCFIKVDHTDARNPGTIWTYSTVADAFEGKVYGEYAWHTEKGKKYWEVPPFSCKVTLQSGEEKTCNSDDEFKALTKSYLE